MTVDQELVDAAVNLVENRLPGQEWAGSAAMRLDDGAILTSTSPTVCNLAVETFHETGECWILAPCGECQERLFSHGPAVAVAVPEIEDPRRWRSLRLDQVQPHWWSKIFADVDAEPR